MGVAASFDTGLVTTARGPNRYFCHSCHRVFSLFRADGSNGFFCPHCESTFLEEVGPMQDNSRMHGQLTMEQARRIANATAMLRLLEAQLRDELEVIQRAFDQANQRMLMHSQEKPKEFTKVMKSKLRHAVLDLDMVCSQPSCPICSEDFPVGLSALRLPCSHWFHSQCVMPWLEMKQNCPICRTEVSDALPTTDELAELSVEELDERLKDLNVEVVDLGSKEKSELTNLYLSKLTAHQAAQAERVAPTNTFSMSVIPMHMHHHHHPSHQTHGGAGNLPFITFAIRHRNSDSIQSASGSSSSRSGADDRVIELDDHSAPGPGV